MLHLSPRSVHLNRYERNTVIDPEDVNDCNKVSPQSLRSACCLEDNTGMRFDLYENDTQYVVYQVAVDNDVKQFELSVKATLRDPGSQQSLSEETLSIQPWQSSDVITSIPTDGCTGWELCYNGPDVSNTTASAASANFSGTVIMGNIGVESYDIFSPDFDSLFFYLLTQTSLEDEGERLHEATCLNSIYVYILVSFPALTACA